MIENVDLILSRDPCGFEVGNRGDNVARGHITRGVVVKADDQYTRVRSVTCPDNLV